MQKLVSRSFYTLVTAAVAAQFALLLPQESVAQEDSERSIFYRPGFDHGSLDDGRDKDKNSDGKNRAPAAKYGRAVNSYAALEAKKFHKNDKPESYLDKLKAKSTTTRSGFSSAAHSGSTRSGTQSGALTNHSLGYSRVKVGSGLLLRNQGSLSHARAAANPENNHGPAGGMFGFLTRVPGSSAPYSSQAGSRGSSRGGFASLFQSQSRSRRPL